MHQKIMVAAMRDYLSGSYESVPPRSAMDDDQRAYFAHVGRVIRENRQGLAHRIKLHTSVLDDIGREVQAFYAVRKPQR